MTDTVTISRACLQHVSDALNQCKAEIDDVEPLPFCPCKGALGFFEVEYPEAR